MKIRLDAVGPDDPWVGKIFYNLGKVHNLKGEKDISIDYFERSLSLRFKVLGSNHQDSISTQQMIDTLKEN